MTSLATQINLLQIVKDTRRTYEKPHARGAILIYLRIMYPSPPQTNEKYSEEQGDVGLPQHPGRKTCTTSQLTPLSPIATPTPQRDTPGEALTCQHHETSLRDILRTSEGVLWLPDRPTSVGTTVFPTSSITWRGRSHRRLPAWGATSSTFNRIR